jgi:hypothetical protein
MSTEPPLTPTALTPFLWAPMPMSVLVQLPVTVTDATGTPPVLTTDAPHYFVTGDLVALDSQGVVPVTVIDATHFSIPDGTAITTPVEATRTTPVEPLTLEEGKLRAGFDWVVGDPREPLMQDFIAAARSQVEKDTCLALLTQVRDVYWKAPTSPALLALSQMYPLQAVLGDRPSAIAGVTITRIVSGFPSIDRIPPGLLQGVGLLTAHWATLGRDLATIDRVAEVPMAYHDAIGPHALVTLA